MIYFRLFFVRGQRLHTFIWHENIPARAGFSLRRVVTVFGEKEFAAIRAYCKRKGISLYSLAKAAIREYMQRHR